MFVVFIPAFLELAILGSSADHMSVVSQTEPDETDSTAILPDPDCEGRPITQRGCLVKEEEMEGRIPKEEEEAEEKQCLKEEEMEGTISIGATFSLLPFLVKEEETERRICIQSTTSLLPGECRLYVIIERSIEEI